MRSIRTGLGARVSHVRKNRPTGDGRTARTVLLRQSSPSTKSGIAFTSELKLQMRNIISILVAEIVVVATAATLISGAHIYVLPVYFSDRKTYSILIAGLAIATVMSWYILQKALIPGRSWNWLLIVGIGGAVVSATLVLSLFFISNSRGS